MKHLTILLALTLGLASCTRTETYPLGTDVTVTRSDSTSVSGRLVEVKPDRIVVQRLDGGDTEVLKSQIASLKAMSPLAAQRPTTEGTPPAAAEAIPLATGAPAGVDPASLASKPRPTAAAKPKPAAPRANSS